MLAAFFLFTVLALSVANGANDNFKGMATLWGSGTLSYSRALVLANIATFLGGCAAIYLGSELVRTFSGKGIVAGEVLADPIFAGAFAFGAAFTVALATFLRYPVSTTHAILGSLTGAALAFPEAEAAMGSLFDKAFLPLLLSPLLAILLTFGVWRSRAVLKPRHVIASLVEPAQLTSRYAAIVDKAHMASGFSVCFARGVNDTPKIASIFLLANGLALSPTVIFLAVALMMVVGGFLFSRDVAHVMSKEVTEMTPSQGFAGNLVTAFLVIFASKFGFGVSTTHVSVGSLIGIGAFSRQAKWKKITHIFAAWILTLPCGFLAAYFAVGLLS